MDLKSGYPYYLIRNGLPEEYETLLSDHRTGVVILGGGVSGALMAYELVKLGIECTVIDRRAIGLGSTCASTSLLQYEIDVPLHHLKEQIGQKDAVRAYRMCSESIDKLKDISAEIGFPRFESCKSLYFSHSKTKGISLREEFDSRKEAGFDVYYLEEKEIREQYGFAAAEAILSSQAAKTDAYLFTHYLHTHNRRKGCHVFENTFAEKIIHHKEGIELLTDKGHRITARKIIHATGYESICRLPDKIVDLKSTFACVSEKIPHLPDFFREFLLWNTDDPYLYIRESEGRIITGGNDEKFFDPEKREKVLNKKARDLEEKVSGLFPAIGFRKQFAWAGTFGSTKDGLPYIGSYKKEPNSYFALGFGGNGITFSVIAAELIAGLLKEETSHIPAMFGFDR